ncbi:CheR family methyltransferase [Noviherbaspirillum soli]|uniref:CheR family methyltransferase n=1 Tax=Noviherbaspirillum soli TaxID=1064518 RepID=UPI00188C4E39|nr:CheR family methyltransferase [Noviherbaspirillum soli]
MAVPVSPVPAAVSTVEEIEAELLLEALYRMYGTDLRAMERTALRPRLVAFMRRRGLASLSAVQAEALHDQALGVELLRCLCLRPAALFDDPARIALLRQTLGPWLRSCPVARVWISECSGAEDVYTLAILLREEGFYDKTLLFATAASEAMLDAARTGRFHASELGRYQQNYLRSGGRHTLADYLVSGEPDAEGNLSFRPELGRNIIWAQYNLATDATFNEFQLIVCRGALSDLQPALRERALRLFHESLAVFGYLSVHPADALNLLPNDVDFRAVHADSGLYRRIR